MHKAIEYAFKNIRKDGMVTLGTCNFCTKKTKVIRCLGTRTYNFLRHFKSHRAEYMRYVSKTRQTLNSPRCNPKNVNNVEDNPSADRTEIENELGSANSNDTLQPERSPANPSRENFVPSAELEPVCDLETAEGDCEQTVSGQATDANMKNNHEEKLEESVNEKSSKFIFLIAECECCKKLETLEEIVQAGLASIMATCDHSNKTNCCCSKKTSKLGHVNVKEAVPKVQIELKNIEKSFGFRIDSSGTHEYICLLCLQYSHAHMKKTSSGRDWISGMKFESVKLKNRYMREHLGSKQHSIAVARHKKDDDCQIKEGRPTFKDVAESTENLMKTGVFMASNCLPHRMLPQIGALMKTVCPNDAPNPIGNKHLSYTAVPKILLASYQACKGNSRAFFSTPNHSTRLKPMVALFVDKMTAARDVTRQVIVVSFLSESGLPKEQLLACTAVRNGDVASSTEHLKSIVSEFMGCEQVAFITADNASALVGSQHGIAECMKGNRSFKNIQRLPDFSHKVENLMTENLPKWVEKTIDDCRTIAFFVNDHNVKAHVQQFINVSEGATFRVIPTFFSTRFAEYLPQLTQAVLQNVKILTESLPSLIDHPNLWQKALSVLELVSSSSFIARVMLITEIYQKVSLLEKEAQSVAFGPFEYISLIEDLKEKLRLAKSIPETAFDVMHHGKLSLSFESRTVKVDLTSVSESLSPKTRENEHTPEELTRAYEEWIDSMLSSISNYLVIPKSVTLATAAFSIHVQENSKNIISLQEFARTVNFSFRACSSICEKFDCECFTRDYNELKSTLRMSYRPVAGGKLQSKADDSAIRYIEAFATLFDEEKHPSISINMLRLIEFVQLLKPSQATTERVLSQISECVEKRFESGYLCDRNSSTGPNDMVNVEVFLRFNTNFVQLDAALARNYFVEAGHQGALMKTEALCMQSSTVLTLLNSMAESRRGKKSKPKQHCMEESNEPTSKRRKLIKRINVKHKSSENLANKGMTNQADSPLKTIKRKPSKTSSYNKNVNVHHQCLYAKTRNRNDTTPSYCVSSPGESSSDWIGCQNEQNCESFIRRQNTEGAYGGDWFHVNCVGLDAVPRESWYCSLCRNIPNTSNDGIVTTLFDALQLEGRKLLRMRGDGNCLYRALSCHYCQSQEKHQLIRSLIYKKVVDLLDDQRWENQWTCASWTTTEAAKLLDDADGYLVRSIAMHNSSTSKEEDTNEEVRKRIRSRAEAMKTTVMPDDGPETKFLKYGGSTDLVVYSCLFKKVIWILSKYGRKYHWRAQYTFKKMTFQEMTEYPDYIALRYERNKTNEKLNHFDAIVNLLETVPPPDVSLEYV